jgi:hypothetical protein
VSEIACREVKQLDLRTFRIPLNPLQRLYCDAFLIFLASVFSIEDVVLLLIQTHEKENQVPLQSVEALLEDQELESD